MRLLILILFVFLAFLSHSQQPTFLKNQQFQVPYKIYPTPFLGEHLNSLYVIWRMRDRPGGSPRFYHRMATYDQNGNFDTLREIYVPYFERSINQMHEFKNGFILNTRGVIAPGDEAGATYFLDSTLKLGWFIPQDSSLYEMEPLNDSIMIGYGAVGIVDSLGDPRLNWFIAKLNINTGNYIWKKFLKDDPKFTFTNQDNLGIIKVAVSKGTALFLINRRNDQNKQLLVVDKNGLITRQLHVKKNVVTIYNSFDDIVWQTSDFFYDSINNFWNYRDTFNIVDFKTLRIKSSIDYTNNKNYPSFSLISAVQSNIDSTYLLNYALSNSDSVRKNILILNKEGVKIQEFHFNGALPIKFRPNYVKWLSNRGFLFNVSLHQLETESFIMRSDSCGNVYNSDLKGLDLTNNSCNALSNDEYANDKLTEPILVFPNPTSSTLTIYTQNTNQQSYSLLDLNGRQILSGYFSKQTQLNVSALKTGMYFLRVENKKSGEIVTQKVIVWR